MKKKNGNEEPKLWVTVIKLIVVATVLIGGVGLALKYAAHLGTSTPGPTQDAWGLKKDSPTRMKR